MNLGRFHAAVYSITEEYGEGSIIEHLNNALAALQQSVAQPNAPANAEAFKLHLSNLNQSLRSAPSNLAIPTLRKIYEEIGATDKIGIGLLDRIDNELSTNNFTPSLAVAGLQEIIRDVTTFNQYISQINIAFSELEIEFDQLDEGAVEIGISLPRGIVGEEIGSLERELHKMSIAFKGLKEVAGDDAADMRVSSISASEWQFFLESAPATALLLSAALERIVALYKTNLEIKILKKQLEDKELPETVTQPLKEYIDDHIKEEMQKIAGELVSEFYKGDGDGRENELRTHLTSSLTYIGERIEKGASIEARAEPPSEQDEDGEPIKLNAAQKKLASDIREINSRMENVVHTQALEGRPLMLGVDAEEPPEE